MIRTFVVATFVLAAAAIGAAPVAAGAAHATTNSGIDALAPNEVSPSQPATGVNFDLSDQPLSPVSQQNAVRAAEQYLDYTSFSRGGLIQQLEFDGFTPSQAAYGVSTTGL